MLGRYSLSQIRHIFDIRIFSLLVIIKCPNWDIYPIAMAYSRVEIAEYARNFFYRFFDLILPFAAALTALVTPAENA